MKISWNDGPVFYYGPDDNFKTYYQRSVSVGGIEGGSRTQYSLEPFPPASPDWDEVITDSEIILIPLAVALKPLKAVAGMVRVNTDFYEPYVSVKSRNMFNTYLLSLFIIDGIEYLGLYANGRRTIYSG